ncbi:MAG: ROK family protein [Verrucomicrobiota bacterium]|nr:ROK family protein [Verrucomicrobiota bacterium]
MIPKLKPALDPAFRPAALCNREFRAAASRTGAAVPVGIALEQRDGSISSFSTILFPNNHPASSGNFIYLERLVKFLLWSRGGFRIHFSGPSQLAGALRHHYQTNPTGRFDAEVMGERIYEAPFEIIECSKLPPDRSGSTALGRHLNGCRIGFDLGGSDRKVAAVIDGKSVFSEEIVWDPVPKSDPQWHFDQILDSLKRAAEHLPRVDAIGGSSAGVYVNNRVKIASLFRGVPKPLFETRVKDIFIELRKYWNGIPFEIANDGEVTALAGSMSLGKNAVLGLAMGSSTAGGYVNAEGNITTWLNELAFAPIDYQPDAPRDEWSGDCGCAVQYLSQQAVGRLLGPAGIELPETMPLPVKLKEVQHLMEQEDSRAEKIYQTIGIYFGYALLHYTDFYDLEHVLLLGRVTSGAGGEMIVRGAEEVLKAELAGRTVTIHIPDELEKRHGQAIAAASLPAFP